MNSMIKAYALCYMALSSMNRLDLYPKIRLYPSDIQILESDGLQCQLVRTVLVDKNPELYKLLK